MNHIIVTGASKGIGFEIVLDLITRPEIKILALSRSEKGLQELRQLAYQLNPDSVLKTFSLDLTEESYGDLEPLIHEFLDGKVHTLINNAGGLIRKPFLEISIEEFRSMLEINFLAPVKMIQFLLPYFSDPSHIVNIGSMSGFQGSVKFSGLSAYGASKGALHALTEGISVELKDKGIRINALALGAVQTDMFDNAFEGNTAPVLAYEMGAYIAHFALYGGTYFNGKIIPVAVEAP